MAKNGTRASSKPSGRIRAAVLTDRGHCVSETDMHRLGLALQLGDQKTLAELVRTGNEDTQHAAIVGVMKGMGGPNIPKSQAATETDATAVNTDGDPFTGFRLAGELAGLIVDPPYKADVLQATYDACVPHASCIDTKARDYSNHGWKLLLRPEMAEVETGHSDLEQAKIEALAFLEHCSDGMFHVEHLARSICTDYERYGTLAFEVVRNADGLIVGLYHIPFATVKVLRSYYNPVDEKTGLPLPSYVQCRFGQTVFYVQYGALCEYPEGFDPYTAPVTAFPALDKRQGYIRYAKPPYVSSTRYGEVTDKREEAAHELMLIARPPKDRSTVYGTPAAWSALPSILAMTQAMEYNRRFFDAYGVPEYAVIIREQAQSGVVQLKDDKTVGRDDMAAVEAAIKEFFESRARNIDRNVLVLGMPNGSAVEFQRISPESIDASFLQFDERCAMRIQEAHGVPPVATGGTEDKRGGQNYRDNRVRLLRYRTHIVAPGQQMLEGLVDMLLRTGLLIPYYNFRFNPMPVDDELDRKELDLKEFIQGGITLNEYRTRQGLPAFTSTASGTYSAADAVVLRTAQIAVITKDGQLITTKPGDAKDPNIPLADVAAYDYPQEPDGAPPDDEETTR